jgi:DNA-binding NarL/FixJ family response regulator
VALRRAASATATSLEDERSARARDRRWKASSSLTAEEAGRAAPLVDERIRVLVADHSPSTRAGVRLALESDGCSVCAEAGDASAAVEAALHERPDVCLLDSELPGGSIAAAAEISSKLPDTRVVVFSDSRSDADLFAALQAGASGYLLKDVDPARLAITLRRLLKGEAALPRALVTRLIEEFRQRERRRRLAALHDLTNREFEVLELLSQNLSTAEIADRLFVAKVTVRTHVASTLKKLGVPDRQSAIRLLENA